MADNNEEGRIDVDSFDFANEGASEETPMLVNYLITRLQQAMANPALQCEVQQQLQAYGFIPPHQEERIPEKSLGETSKRGTSKDLFQPLKISESLWIIPQWRSPPESTATNIILDPGLAFGTGDHPTTQLCLRWLKNVVEGGEEILDYGTGSGILAITALKLGAAQAVGVDIDPMAISSATHNASLNGYGPDSLRLSNAPAGNELIPAFEKKYDIVVANLLLNPLVLLSECLLSYTKPGGQLGLSGILESQIDEVREAYGLQLDNISIEVQDGWACLSGTKSSH
ncbi:hypothetical protein L7F22_012755 [Adiantum nelumboides]|nr:hypothetical protein [Adiantum nelumboides]